MPIHAYSANSCLFRTIHITFWVIFCNINIPNKLQHNSKRKNLYKNELKLTI